jgi:DNA polymerase III delta prime subunit
MSSSIVTLDWVGEGIDIKLQLVTYKDDASIDEYVDGLRTGNDGTISRGEYQIQLFTGCLLNLEPVLNAIALSSGIDNIPNLSLLTSLSNELENLIVSVNPELSADNLMLDLFRSKIVRKVNIDDNSIGVIPITLNASWNNPLIYVDTLDDSKSFDSKGGQVNNSDSKSAKIPWPRMGGMKVVVKRFTEADLPLIFEGLQVNLDNHMIYKDFICNKTIDKYKELLQLNKASKGFGNKENEEMDHIEWEHSAVEELYNLVLEVNPFLIYGKHDPKKYIQSKSELSKPTKKSVKTKTAKEQQKTFQSVTKTELLSLSERLKKRVIGQDEAVEKVVEAIQIASCGLRSPEKPIASFLLCGMTGTGKTHLCKMLAEELTGSRDNFARIDCTEYSQAHEVTKLIGSPPSYIGHDEGGYLTNAIQQRPFSVVLFDELEKAHSRLHDILLQIMDDARLTDGKGVVTSFHNCVILLTSNIGVSETKVISKTIGFGDASVLTEEKVSAALEKALKSQFRPEFLNRLDGTATFAPLSEESALKIVDIHLSKVTKQLENKGITIKFTNSLKEAIRDKGFSKEYGARPLERVIEKEISKVLSKKLLLDEIKENDEIRLSWKDDSVVVETKQNLLE